ncbi:MAG: MFS transporter, partial [candidate division WOR-3 bacterium]
MNTIKRKARFNSRLWSKLILSFTILLLGYSTRNSFAVFCYFLERDFGWSRAQMAIMFSISVLLYGFTAPLAGRVTDQFGAKRVVSLGSFLMGLSFIFCGMANALVHFYVLYAIVAIGLSLVGWTPVSTYISHIFQERRCFAFGVLNAGFGASLLVASPTEALISTVGWRVTYVIMGVICVILAVPARALLLEKGKDENAGKFMNLDSPPETPTLGWSLRSPNFWILFAAAFLTLGFSEQIILSHLICCLIEAGFLPAEAAKTYSILGATFIIGSLFSFVGDAVRKKLLLTALTLTSALGVTLLLLGASKKSFASVFVLTFGFGMGMTGPVIFAMAADLFHGPRFGSIQGTIFVGFSLGGTLGPWLAGYVHDLESSYDLVLTLVMLALFTSSALSLLLFDRSARNYS